MYKLNKKNVIFVSLIFILIFGVSCTINSEKKIEKDKSLKLYWFIPDGVRADPDLFKLFEWAEAGELPNIKKLMEKGSYGYSIPTFPSHTPTNFATLLTGTYPEKHGVADGPMHVEGAPLNKVSVAGFSSVAKKNEPIWTTLEKNDLNVALLSMPGSTPPELDKGMTIRGRWGGWGADFHAINFEYESNLSQRKKQGRGSRLFFFGPELTRYIKTNEPKNWTLNPKSYSPPFEIELSGWGEKIYGYVYDSTNDESENYNKILFSPDKRNKWAVLEQGEWSEWNPLVLNWNSLDVDTHVIINIIKLEDDGFFRIRLFYNNLNEYNVKPSSVRTEFNENLGPMVDFVDNFPPQLIYYPEDKKTFLEEMNMSFDWHTKEISFVDETYNPDVIIHDIYSPNQMLTSRWWLGYIDPVSKRYNEVDNQTREELWKEVKDMYKELDKMVGEILKVSDENTIIVFSSDHGAVPLNKWVRLNNFFAEKGWLDFEIDPTTGEPIIDWKNSQVIYLKMDNIYIDPEGLDGNWTRASGEEYEKLRQEVINSLRDIEDPETGENPVRAVVKWEDVSEYLDLPKDRVGDLIIANEAGYGWNEEMTEDRKIFDTPLKTGYKQAIFANETKGMWSPFIIAGSGIKEGYELSKPIEHVDQYPTILHLLNIESPNDVDGKILREIFK